MVMVKRRRGGRFTPKKVFSPVVVPTVREDDPVWIIANDLDRRLPGLPDTLGQLRSLRAIDRRLHAKIERVVAAARQGGHSWAEIGAALGVSAQAVWKRFGRAGRPVGVQP